MNNAFDTLYESIMGDMEEDFESLLGAENKFPDGKDKYEVVDIGGMHGQAVDGGRKFDSLQAACDAAGADIKDCYEDVDGWEDMEGDGTTLEFVVDEDTAIVMHKFDGPRRKKGRVRIDRQKYLNDGSDLGL